MSSFEANSLANQGGKTVSSSQTYWNLMNAVVLRPLCTLAFRAAFHRAREDCCLSPLQGAPWHAAGCERQGQRGPAGGISGLVPVRAAQGNSCWLLIGPRISSCCTAQDGVNTRGAAEEASKGPGCFSSAALQAAQTPGSSNSQGKAPRATRSVSAGSRADAAWSWSWSRCCAAFPGPAAAAAEDGLLMPRCRAESCCVSTNQ